MGTPQLSEQHYGDKFYWGSKFGKGCVSVCLCTQPCCVWPMVLGLVSSAVETPTTEGGHQTSGDRDTMGPHGNTATQSEHTTRVYLG